jgi:uncharacterized membrane protein
MKKRKYNYWRCNDFPFYRRGMDCMREFYLDKSNAMEILKIRYAKGEINEEQYVKMKKEVQ